MQRLTAMTIGAALLGLAGFVCDNASAQTPKTCSTRAVDIYFDRNSTEFNQFSQQLVERMAQEARNCGSKQVVVESAAGAERAKAVFEKFQSLGVKVILMGQPVALEGESVADRAVTIRVAGRPNAMG